MNQHVICVKYMFLHKSHTIYQLYSKHHNVDVYFLLLCLVILLLVEYQYKILQNQEFLFFYYYKNPEATANAFTEDGWLRTGDLGVMDAEGNIFIRGRSKNMILSSSGQNIYPEEIEVVVNNQPFVMESVVVERGGKLVALVYLDEQSIAKSLLDTEAKAEIPENIKLGANRQLPGYSQIAKVELVDKPFEKTPKMSIRRFLYK